LPEETSPTDNTPALPDETRLALRKLKDLSDRAEDGDGEARRELRRFVASASPKIVAEASSFARRGERLLAGTIAGGEPLMEEALIARLQMMRREIAGLDPTPLERLLAERVVAYWLLVKMLEESISANLDRENKENRFSFSLLKLVIKWQDSVHKRHLSAIKTLAQVRRLQRGSSLQINVGTQQVNISGDPDPYSVEP
jgi:hypothetical protein